MEESAAAGMLSKLVATWDIPMNLPRPSQHCGGCPNPGPTPRMGRPAAYRYLSMDPLLLASRRRCTPLASGPPAGLVLPAVLAAGQQHASANYSLVAFSPRHAQLPLSEVKQLRACGLPPICCCCCWRRSPFFRVTQQNQSNLRLLQVGKSSVTHQEMESAAGAEWYPARCAPEPGRPRSAPRGCNCRESGVGAAPAVPACREQGGGVPQLPSAHLCSQQGKACTVGHACWLPMDGRHTWQSLKAAALGRRREARACQWEPGGRAGRQL